MGNRKSRRQGKSRRRSEKTKHRHEGRYSETRNLGRHHQEKGNLRTFVGTVEKNARGFAFVTPKEGHSEDIYLSPEEAAPLLNGDLVEISVRSMRGRTQGVVHRVLKRGSSTLVGKVEAHGKNWWVLDSQGQGALITKSQSAKPGEWVLAEWEEYPRPNQSGTVSILQRLGKELGPESDFAVTVSRFDLATEFSEPAIVEAENKARHSEEELSNPRRKDLTGKPLVTIDGEDAKDFDDAVYAEETSSGGFKLWVAIADVSFFVTPGSPLDREARKRGTSVYFPGTCVPMLPEILSNQYCSLRPREKKLCLVAEIEYPNNGNVIRPHFYTAVIKTAERLTYKQVELFFEKDPEIRKSLQHIQEPLLCMQKLFHVLEKKRKERGVLDFNLPENKVEVDSKGRPLRLIPSERYSSHRLIEEFMIAANQAVAKVLREKNHFSVFRVHLAPDADKLDQLNELLHHMGLPARLKDVSPKAFSAILESTRHHPGAQTLHQAILRMQKQARYEAHPKGHFGLALSDYTHFTSPIRRYPDLVVHRSLKTLITPHEYSDKKISKLEDFISIGEETSFTERRAMEAERFIVRRKQCWYLKDQIGNEFDAGITGVVEGGCFTALEGLGAEGFIPLDWLDGLYEFDPRKLCLRKRPGPGTLSLGDRLRVAIGQVSVEEGRVTLQFIKKL